MSTGKVAVNGQEIVEGTANMFYDSKELVFYNKVQVFNRDTSIQVIKLFSEKLVAERKEKYQQKLERYQAALEKHRQDGESATNLQQQKEPLAPREGITILDALAASGLRSIRYLKEIPLVEHVTINDLSTEATKLATENCIRNHVDMNKVIVNNQDATALMYEHRDPLKQYDVIDLDPYGSVVNFLDAAVQSVVSGGLLCITCTDMTVLSGSYPEVCFSKYYSMPVRGKYVHEMSLRVLLHSIDLTANKYKRYIVPWISLSVDFYVRVFVRVYESPQEVKNSCLRRCMLYQAVNSPTYYVQPLGDNNRRRNYTASTVTAPHRCEETGSPLKIGGPFWSESMHDQQIVDELLLRVKDYDSSATNLEKAMFPVSTIKRIIGVMTSISEEIKDVPFFYSLPELASAIHVKVPTYDEFRSALQRLNYRVSQFHHEPNAVKTDAPNNVIWDVMRAYAKIHPPVENSKKGLSDAAKAILGKEIKTEVDFTVTTPRRLDRSIARFPFNPEANWGPKRKAGRLIKEGQSEEDGVSQKKDKRKKYQRNDNDREADRKNSDGATDEPVDKKSRCDDNQPLENKSSNSSIST